MPGDKSFPATALAVKEIWEEPQPCFTEKVAHYDNCVFLNVYRPEDSYNTASVDQLNPVIDWDVVVVDLKGGPCDGAPITPIPLKQFQRFKDENRKPTSIQCFHYLLPNGQHQVAANASNAATLLPSLFSINSSIPVILVGFHVSSAEIPNWTWATFWWTADTTGDLERPAIAAQSPVWRHFKMNTSFGPSGLAAAKNAGPPPPLNNPYLEGTQEFGQVSNCLYCHSRALSEYKAPLNLGAAIDAGHPARCIIDKLPGCQEPQLPASDFPADLRTHFLWGLAQQAADHTPPPATQTPPVASPNRQ